MGVVKGAIGIKDNVTSVLKSICKSQAELRKDTVRTQSELKRTWGKKYQATLAIKDTATAKVKSASDKVRAVGRMVSSPIVKLKDSVTSSVSKVKSRLVGIARFVAAPIIKLKDSVTSKIQSVTSKVRAVGKMVATPVVKLKDNLSSGIAKAKSKLKSIAKSVAIPVTIAATVASVVLGSTVSAGMKLEQQQVSMEHFIGATNKGISPSEIKQISSQFTEELRNNANATPFETGEVMAAGSRAIAISSGNTKDAMSLIKLAEDMAAASGGTQDLASAVEALADLKMGETERLKAFGFKVSAEDFQTKGYAGLSSELEGFFGGAAGKLATTGAGLVSTIKGKLKSNVSDLGLSIVNEMKPALESVIGAIDSSSPQIESFGKNVASFVGGGIKSAMEFIPKLVSAINTVKPVFTAIVTTISSAIQTMAPVVTTIMTGIGDKIGVVMGYIGENMGFIKEVFDTVTPAIAEVLSAAWTVISPILDIAITAFTGLFEVVKLVFPKIKEIISSVWDFLKPIVEGIGGVISNVAGEFKEFIGGLFSGGDVQVNGSVTSSAVGKNANGTNNWRGGLTWVGENGAELIDLPKGSRVMSNKSSNNYINRANQNSLGQHISITIAKLADQIIVREDADIDRIGEALANKILIATANMA